jgi:hypothetical protein
MGAPVWELAQAAITAASKSGAHFTGASVVENRPIAQISGA